MGKLDALIGADGTVEDHPLFGVRDGPVDEPASVSDGLGGYQYALRVPRVDDMPKPLPLLTDQVLRGHLQVVEEDGVGVVVEHDVDGLDLDGF